MQHPDVKAFFDEPTNTFSYVVSDPTTRRAAVIDSVLDYDAASGRTGHGSANMIVAFVRASGLSVDWLIDTHVHADHLSAAAYLQPELGGTLAIGEHIRTVQNTFGKLFHREPSFRADGSQFDHLFADGERYRVGNIDAVALHTPGHTPACMTHVIGDAAFVGDTLFMPDYGTARCDFPGGDARTLYRSIQTIYALPRHPALPVPRLQGAGTRPLRPRNHGGRRAPRNLHVRDGVDEDASYACAKRATPPCRCPGCSCPRCR